MRNCAPKRGVREIPHLNNSIQAIEDKTPSGQPIVGREKVCQLVSSWNHQARKKNSFSYPHGTSLSKLAVPSVVKIGPYRGRRAWYVLSFLSFGIDRERGKKETRHH